MMNNLVQAYMKHVIQALFRALAARQAPSHTTVLEPPFTVDQLKALRERNSERARDKIAALGTAYALYPDRDREPVQAEELPDFLRRKA